VKGKITEFCMKYQEKLESHTYIIFLALSLLDNSQQSVSRSTILDLLSDLHIKMLEKLEKHQISPVSLATVLSFTDCIS
jgi:hypothetical protein